MDCSPSKLSQSNKGDNSVNKSPTRHFENKYEMAKDYNGKPQAFVAMSLPKFINERQIQRDNS